MKEWDRDGWQRRGTVQQKINLNYKRSGAQQRPMPRSCLIAVVCSVQLLCTSSERAAHPELEDSPTDDIVQLESIHGHVLSAEYNDQGRLILVMDDEGFGADLQPLLWNGGVVLRSTQHRKVLGIKDGAAFFGLLACPEATDCDIMGPSEVLYVHEELIGSYTVSLRTEGGAVLGCDEGRNCASNSEAAGLNEMFLVLDVSMRSHMTQLQQEGYTVIKVLSTDEAADVRRLLDLHSERGGSNGYQIRIPDVLVHDPIYAELLTHPRVLQLVRSYLGKFARCATWSSNTLLPHMDHPVLGWHVDYPYHDIEAGSWGTDVSLGLQVLWMVDDFREDNGGTMFLPGSHEWLTPPHIDDFSWPDGAQVLSATAGHVLVAHSAWWHRQTQNTSPSPRHALLACFVRGFVVPKADVESQFQTVSNSPGYWAELDVRQQHELRRLLLGPHRRANRGYQA